MKKTLFKTSLVLMSSLILDATTIPNSFILANELDSTAVISDTSNILSENDKLIINGKEITESEFNSLLEDASDITFEEQKY